MYLHHRISQLSRSARLAADLRNKVNEIITRYSNVPKHDQPSVNINRLLSGMGMKHNAISIQDLVKKVK